MIASSGYLYGGGLGDWRLVARADMNGDGFADLVFQNGVGQIYLWFLDGSGTAVNFSTGSGLKAGKSPSYLYGGGLGGWRLVACADVNGDGFADLVFQYSTGETYVWFLDGTGNAVNFGTGAGLKAGLSPRYLYSGGLGDWRVAAVADMNSDAKADLLFQNNAGQIYVWFLDGTGTGVNFSSGVGLKAGLSPRFLYSGGLADWRVRTMEDINNDGVPDVVLQNNAGQIYSWYLDGTGNTVNFSTGVGLKPGSNYLYTGALGDWRVR